jgi:hypothetical protein
MSQNGQMLGVNVMITNFYDFRKFSAEKIGIFLEYQCNDHSFAETISVLSRKRQFIRQIFRL